MNKQLNDYLDNERLDKEKFDDLKIVVDTVGFNKKILDWFRELQKYEVIGWRPKLVTQKIARMLSGSLNGVPINFFAMFCPSYKKGEGEYGFRVDDIGDTTKLGIRKLIEISEMTVSMGFNCNLSEAIFFDIALEQPKKAVSKISDLCVNIENLKRYLPEKILFSRLSEKYPWLYDIVGYSGVKIDPLPVDDVVMRRIIERGEKFYKLFGWNKKQIVERSKVIASSESMVGTMIRYGMPNSVMVYTPTMLERAQVYSGKKLNTDPLPIIFPKKEG